MITDKQGVKTTSLDKPNIIFTLRDDNNNDTIYCFNPWKFILVPYFVKQKQIHEGKTFLAFNKNDNESFDVSSKKSISVPTLSKWTCKVDIFNMTPRGGENEEYKLYCVLENDRGETILRKKLEGYEWDLHFIEENEYLRSETEKKLKQEQLIEEQKKRELLRKEKERKESEKHKEECINKFGKIDGELIAQGKVKIGMTKKMCKVAWGSPFWTDKVTTEYGIKENWYYGFGFSLSFKNGLLNIIDE